MLSIPIDSFNIPPSVKRMLDNFTDEDFDDNIVKSFQVLCYGHFGEDLNFTQEQFERVKNVSALLDIQLSMTIAADDSRFQNARVDKDRRFPRNKAEVLFYLDLIQPTIVIEYIDEVPVSTLSISETLKSFWTELDSQSEDSNDEDHPSDAVSVPSNSQQAEAPRKGNRKRGVRKNKGKSVIKTSSAPSPPTTVTHAPLRDTTIVLGNQNTSVRRDKWRRLAAKEGLIDHYGQEENLDVRSLLIKFGRALPFKSIYFSKTLRDFENHTCNARRWNKIPDEIITDDLELFGMLNGKYKVNFNEESISIDQHYDTGTPPNENIESWFDCMT